jgi:hypothetical protein
MVKKKTATKATKTPLRVPTTGDDVKSALLVVSLVINAVVLIGWITLQVTSKYDEQVTQFLMG